MQATQNSQNNLGKDLSLKSHTSQFQNLPKAIVINTVLGLRIDIPINGTELRVQK